MIEDQRSYPPDGLSRDDSSLESSAAAARQIQREKGLEAAVAAWAAVRTCFPNEPIGYSAGGSVLWKLHRIEEANAVLAAGLERFPKNESLMVEHAWVAHQHRDWAEADRRWEIVRQQHPGSFGGYLGGGIALRSLGRFDEADAVYREGLKRWPQADNLLADFAAAAFARGDFGEAAKRWAALREQYPDKPQGYLPEVRGLREAGRHAEAELIISGALERFPEDAAVLIEAALVARHRGAPLEALKRWEAVITAFPDRLEGHLGAAHALNQLGRFADAENVLHPTLRMFPEAVDLAALYAWIAHYRGQYLEALSRWTKVRTQFPMRPEGYGGGVVSLLALSRAAEAEALANEAMRLFPDHMHVAMSWAEIPQHVQDWEESERRWAMVYKRFPVEPAVHLGYGTSLARSGRWQEAEKLLQAATARHSGDIGLLNAYADLATRQQDWGAAEARWRQVIERFPDRSTGWVGLCAMLSAAGRLDEADVTLKIALARIPGDAGLERQLASTAVLRRDWPTAFDILEELKRKHPHNAAVRSSITQALWHARQDLGAAADEAGVAPFEIPASLLDFDDQSSEAALGQMLMKFESVGDTCEFGIVQRRFGAEPIGLLRWAGISPADLVKALDAEFSGVGEAEYTIIAVLNGEYTTRDTRYHMFSHTFIRENAVPRDQFTVEHLRRMRFLRRKLIKDLTIGDKVFVYKHSKGLSDDEVKALHRAFRRYGKRSGLLCVRIEDETRPSGTLEELGDGLFIGYIDRFSNVNINVDVWVDLCRRTADLWQVKQGVRHD